MRKLTLLLVTFCLLTVVSSANAQNFAHELGVINGPLNFRSDFGVRGDMETNLKNTGYGAGIIHYFNFAYRASCSCFTELTYFNDHFKLRSELSHYTGKLRHYGEWVRKEEERNLKPLLGEMRGKFNITNIGMQLEYYPMSIREFGARGYAFAPFFAIGFHYSMYSPEVYTSLGAFGNRSTTFPKYIAGARDQNSKGGSVMSIVNSVGTRYKISPLSDLIFELRWQYYFNDWVDGVNPDPAIYSENIANDWAVWFNFGYVYTFL
jgi:hypothetical protein